MKEIYLDNSATTPLSPLAKEALLRGIETYGNPSSLHPVGQAAHALLDEARRNVALSLGVRERLQEGQIIFTAGGSEADNLALFGTAYAKERRRGGRIISTDCEHSAIERALAVLETQGFDVVRIPTVGGVLDWEAYAAALNEKTFLVTMMLVNNETGARFDLARAFAMARAINPNVVTHTDAVQGYLKMPMSPTALGADMISVSGHKIHAPKGVGALYVSPAALKRRDLVPTLYGGGQEGGFRSGTENIPGIAAFGTAAKEGYTALAARTAHTRQLRDYAIEALSTLPVVLHLPQSACAPHILNFAVPDIRSETMVHALSQSGICISGGSACSSHAKKLSRSLLAFGIPPEEVECSLRISFSHENSKEDVDALTAALRDAISRLVHVKR